MNWALAGGLALIASVFGGLAAAMVAVSGWRAAAVVWGITIAICGGVTAGVALILIGVGQ